MTQSYDSGLRDQSPTQAKPTGCLYEITGATLAVAAGFAPVAADAAFVPVDLGTAALPISLWDTAGGPHTFYQIDMDSDGDIDFTLDAGYTDTIFGASSGSRQYTLRYVTNDANPGTGATLTPLAAGQLIDASNDWSGGFIAADSLQSQSCGKGSCSSSYSNTGPYVNVSATGSDYMGLQFQDSQGNTRYGWIQLQDSRSSNPQLATTFLLLDFAFSPLPDTPILAGEHPAPVPLPPALGLMAMGAAALLPFRRRQRQASESAAA